MNNKEDFTDLHSAGFAIIEGTTPIKETTFESKYAFINNGKEITDRFIKFIPFVFQWECVYKKGHHGDHNYVIHEEVDGDSGGVTKWGIDYKEYSSKPFILSIDEIKELKKEDAIHLYFYKWNKLNGELSKENTGEILFDTAINMGDSIAHSFLLKTSDPNELLKLREERYNFLVEKNPKLFKFLKGWLNRIDSLKKFLHL